MNNILQMLKNTNENNKIIFKNTLGAFTIKGAALVISLLTLPAYMRYFEEQQILGLWFTILSVLSWILNFDLGIGNGLRNKLVEEIGKDNKENIKKYISSAYYTIALIVFVSLIVGYTISSFINWNAVFNVYENLIGSRTLLQVVRFVFIGIMIQFLLRLITSVLYALQLSAVNNLIALITSLLQLLFIALAPSFSLEINLKMLSCAYIILTNVPLLIATIIIFGTKLKNCFPSIKYVRKNYALSVLRLGGIFFLCQIMYMVIMNTNEFFISRYSGTEFVVEYQIYYKIFTLVGTLFALALTPIWSAITKAVSESDFQWLAILYRRLKNVSLLTTICTFAMVPFLQILVNLWLNNKAIQINYIYALCFALFGSIFIYLSIVSTMVCGIGMMKLQAVCYTIGVIFKVIIIHFGMQLFHSWIIVVIANSMILLPYCVIQQLYLDKYITSKSNKKGK